MLINIYTKCTVPAKKQQTKKYLRAKTNSNLVAQYGCNKHNRSKACENTDCRRKTNIKMK